MLTHRQRESRNVEPCPFFPRGQWFKCIFVIVVPAGAAITAAALWLQCQHSVLKPHPVAGTKPATEQHPARVNGPLPPLLLAVSKPRPVAGTPVTTEQRPTGVNGPLPAFESGADTIRGLIVAKATHDRNSAELTVWLKKVHGGNPDGLFDALMAIGRESLATRRSVLPLLAEALTLWPEAEGRYIGAIADAYAGIDLSAAAEWGASFLVKTGRSDQAASSLLGRLSAVSEDRALSLIASLPEGARRDAMNSVAYHMELADLDHLMQVCANLDPQGISTFSKQLFERLGMERLDETAAWLLHKPETARIPGAIASISRALVINHGPHLAMTWADSLPDANTAAQAITAIYREWAKEGPENAIQDILSTYDRAPQLMTDVFKGAAEHHGRGAVMLWGTACGLGDASARAYALSALVEPMLITVGPVEMEAKLSALSWNSVERTAVELMLHAAYRNPATVKLLATRFGE